MTLKSQEVEILALEVIGRGLRGERSVLNIKYMGVHFSLVVSRHYFKSTEMDSLIHFGDKV